MSGIYTAPCLGYTDTGIYTFRCVVALQEKGRPGFWLVVHSDDLVEVAREVKP